MNKLIAILFICNFNGPLTKQSNTFEDLLTLFPEYKVPLDIKSLTFPLPNDTLSHARFREHFTAFSSLVYIGENDTTKVYPLGRVKLHPEYHTLLYTLATREYNTTVAANFDFNGEEKFAIEIELRDTDRPGILGSLFLNSFIQADSTIYRRDASGEEILIKEIFEISPTGGFSRINYSKDENYYDGLFWEDKRKSEMDSLTLAGPPILTGN